MDTEEAKAITRRGEGQHTEFKKSLSADNEAIKSLCAFANADGGTVFFGITNNGEYLGISLGNNTLENFANKLRRETSPPLSPSIEEIRFNGLIIVAATVQKAERGQLYHAFNTPFIRVGKTNQVMSPDEQPTRLISGINELSEVRDNPTFEIISGALTRTENSFEPNCRLKQVSGDYVSNLEWRFRGPRFKMN